MKSYYRIMLGKGSMYADECYKGNYIGTGFLSEVDLTEKLTDDWREFNQQFIPVWLAENPEGSKVAAGLACGALWTVSKGLHRGDIVLCPSGQGSYFVGEIVDDYSYHKGEELPHRRTVRWHSKNIERTQMSESLRNSSGSIGTVSNITKYADEIDRLLSGTMPLRLISTDETVEDPSEFAMEKHLEEFLIQNWSQTDLAKKYDIYEEDGEPIGQQYQTDTGPIDILAISKDKKELLVIELKKGRASDSVVGQIQRYMGYVLEELAEDDQTVKGIIIALEDDIKLRRALAVAANIEFYRYQVTFKLFKG